MDTPGHVSERDGQEEDENKWGVGGGGGGIKKGCRVKDTNARENTTSEVKSKYVLERRERWCERRFGVPRDI